jgi:hypothetical protein
MPMALKPELVDDWLPGAERRSFDQPLRQAAEISWRGMAQTQRHDPAGHETALAAIMAVHTAAWCFIESCMLYVLYAGFKGQSDRRAGIAAGVVAAETLVFAVNGFRCPLTDIAGHLGAEHASVTDIYLPRWFARNLPAIHVPLILLAAFLHGRNLRRARGVR